LVPRTFLALMAVVWPVAVGIAQCSSRLMTLDKATCARVLGKSID
jgi:hypothetical protein